MVEVLTKWLTALQGWLMLIERNSIITTYKWTYSLFIQYICSHSNDLTTWCSSSTFQRMSQLDSPLPLCLSLWLSVCLYPYLSIGLFVSLPICLSFGPFIYPSVYLSICVLSAWSIGCLIHLLEVLTDWLTIADWMTDFLNDWLSEWIIDWLTKWPTAWLTEKLNNQLSGGVRLIEFLSS